MSLIRHQGGCHCGAVRFAVEAPADLELLSCNCSICRMTGFVHLIVPGERFHLLSGENNLTVYRFNTGVAQHMFCKTCGIKSFYVPRSHPDGYSVNANCLTPETIKSLNVTPFDGQNWDSHIGEIR